MIGKELLSNLKFSESYAKFLKEEGRLETWEESCLDVMSMHKNKFSKLDTWGEIEPYYEKALAAYSDMNILASQRNLQFREKHINNHSAKLFNCSTTYIDRPEVFKEIMYVLLCGAGVGYSVEEVFVNKLPQLKKRNTSSHQVHVIDDSIEGWAISVDVLLSSYFNGGEKVLFDYSQIREKGSLIAGEFSAPGHEGLKKSLELIEKLLDNKVNNNDFVLSTLDCHDIICIESDAVLSGGVRRSALICLFDKYDDLMLKCKTGDWWVTAPWRARANNSAKLKKGEFTKEELDSYKEFIKQFGEPGVVMVEDMRVVLNPCCFTGDTKILTADGYKPIKECVPYTQQYLINERGERVNGKCWSNGYKQTIKVNLSNGKIIKCTPDHRFKLSDGTECIAEQLLGKTVKGFGSFDVIVLSLEIGEVEEVFDFSLDDDTHWGVIEGVIAHNCEIGFIPVNPRTGNSCFSFCNLCEIIGAKCTTEEEFYKACEAAAVIGTFQASYTYMPFLGQDTMELIEWEALLGVSITGIMNNPSILLNPEILRKGAEIVKDTNKKVAELIGINQSARTTCIKPSGNASVLAKTASGIHPAHARRYFRTVQLNKETPMAKYLSENYPEMLEEGVWSSTNSDYACFVPIEETPETVVKSDVNEIEFLENVKIVQQNWVLPGTNKELGYSETVTHNVSNTISVKDWDKTFDYIYENQESFCGLSFLPDSGDKIYKQAPFTEVKTLEEIVDIYKEASIFASGLIVDALHCFNNDLWDACQAVVDKNFHLSGDRITTMVKKDIVSRIKKFARNYFKGNLLKATECLKDVHLYHKWVKINRVLSKKPIDFSQISYKEKYLNADELGGLACSGGSCELTF
jgi:hypothetical protein